MFAVVKTGGKQYLVQPGDKIKVEKLEAEEGKEVTLSEVLMTQENDNITIGTPMIKDAKIIAKVIKHGKGDKLIIFKYKPKKRYKRKIGHRQPFTEIEIIGIS
jgi:large subunit ribosomal protein L21